MHLAMFGLSCRKAWISTGRAISVFFIINILRNELSHFVGHHFQHSATTGWHFPRTLIEVS